MNETPLWGSCNCITAAEERMSKCLQCRRPLGWIPRQKRTNKVIEMEGGSGLYSLSTNEVVGPHSTKEELVKVRVEAQDNKKHMMQYKSIAEVNEVALKQMESTFEHKCDSAFLFGVTLMELACIVWLKLVSYAHTNYDMRALAKSPDKGDVQLESTLDYPNSVNFKSLVYYMLAPTLCYQPSYPRFASIRKGWVARQFIKLIIFTPSNVHQIGEDKENFAKARVELRKLFDGKELSTDLNIGCCRNIRMMLPT